MKLANGVYITRTIWFPVSVSARSYHLRGDYLPCYEVSFRPKRIPVSPATLPRPSLIEHSSRAAAPSHDPSGRCVSL